MSVLKTKKLTKTFDGVKAVNNLSIEIEKGKVTGIVGPNGSGKTTLINTLTGVFPFDSGAVVLRDVKLEKIVSHQIPTYGVTRTFQKIRLIEQLSVLDNILVVLTEKTVGKALFEKHTELHLKQAEELLRRVDLWGKRDEEALNLSYGQRKLLEISRAIAMKTDIILFDEPFAGLFPEMVKLVIGIIEELKAKEKTIVLIEHDMAVIRKLCDHLIVMDAGALLAQGEPNKVLAQKDVIEAYLGE